MAHARSLAKEALKLANELAKMGTGAISAANSRTKSKKSPAIPNHVPVSIFYDLQYLKIRLLLVKNLYENLDENKNDNSNTSTFLLTTSLGISGITIIIYNRYKRSNFLTILIAWLPNTNIIINRAFVLVLCVRSRTIFKIGNCDFLRLIWGRLFHVLRQK